MTGTSMNTASSARAGATKNAISRRLRPWLETEERPRRPPLAAGAAARAEARSAAPALVRGVAETAPERMVREVTSSATSSLLLCGRLHGVDDVLRLRLAGEHEGDGVVHGATDVLAEQGVEVELDVGRL